MKDLLWDDLKIGQKFQSGELQLTKEQIITFAKTFDPQPMHTDEDAAKTSPFGALIGSGWHTLSTTIKLLAEAKPFGQTPLVGMEVDKVRFLSPLFPGATLKAQMEVTDLRPSRKEGRGYVRTKVTTTANGKPILTQEWLMMVPRRSNNNGA